MSVPAAYAAVVLIWSTTPLAILWSLDSVDFLLAVTLRMTLSALFCLSLLPFWRLKLVMNVKAIKSYCAGALGVFAGMMLVYWSAQFVPSGLVSVIMGLSPLITALIAWSVLGHSRLTLVQMLALLLALGGLYLVFATDLNQGLGSYKGILALLGAAVLLALSGLAIKEVNAGLPPLVQTAGTLLISLPLYVLVTCLADPVWPTQWSQRSLFGIGYLALFGSVLGFVFYYYILNHLSATQVALIPMITPVLALALGYLVEGETLSVQAQWGSVLVVAALLLFNCKLRAINPKRLFVTQD